MASSEARRSHVKHLDQAVAAAYKHGRAQERIAVVRWLRAKGTSKHLEMARELEDIGL